MELSQCISKTSYISEIVDYNKIYKKYIITDADNSSYQLKKIYNQSLGKLDYEFFK